MARHALGGGGTGAGFPVEALNLLNAPLLAYVAQVASWCGRPSWASLDVRLSGAGLLVAYIAAAAVTIAALRLARSRRIARLRRRRSRRRAPPRFALAGTVGLIAVALAALVLAPERDASAAPEFGLRVSVLDVSQGDAILLQPAGAPAVLVDGGPPGQRLAGMLDAAGVQQLGAVVVTHDQSDHAGGVEELLGRVAIGRFLYASVGRALLLDARAAGVPARRLGAGAVLRSGGLRLDVIWPPPELLSGSAVEDPNSLALVILARWRDFSMLLTADAEAETAPLDPGPVDVLKVAHHGSEDGGLGALLDRTRPRLAVISVGVENSYGHPTPVTLATLAAHGVRTLRTDRDGTVVLDVHRRSFEVDAGG